MPAEGELDHHRRRGDQDSQLIDDPRE
jgi:hypothetical protein